MGGHALLQGIFWTQRLNPGVLHQQVDSLPLMPPGKPSLTARWQFIIHLTVNQVLAKVIHLTWKYICVDSSVTEFSSVAQLCPTLCDPVNYRPPGLPVHHQLLEFTQTHIHRVGDAIQPSHPLSSPSPPAPNPSQHQGLFQWVNSLHEVAKVLELQL